MATSDPPPNDEQALGKKPEISDCPSKCPDTRNDVTVNSTPPSSENNTEYSNKRKRESLNTVTSIEKETEAVKDISVVTDTAETKEAHVGIIESMSTKEIEMKDAESVDRSAQQGIKDIEMQDAELVYNNKQADGTDLPQEGKMDPDVDKNNVGSNLTATEGCKQDPGVKESEQPQKAENEENEKRSIDAATNDGSGQKALGEVATLLKQVEESDAKAKLEVEVKVRKIDNGDVKENAEISDEAQTVSRLSCP